MGGIPHRDRGSTCAVTPAPDPASRMDPPPDPPPHDRDEPLVPPTTLPDDLLAYARKASAAANRLTPSDGASGVPGHAVDAFAYMRAAHEALRARQIADKPLEPDERAATAHLVKRLRRDLERVGLAHDKAEAQRDDLAAFLGSLADEFDAVHTPGTDKVAGLIRRHLADVLTPDPAAEAIERTPRCGNCGNTAVSFTTEGVVVGCLACGKPQPPPRC